MKDITLFNGTGLGVEGNCLAQIRLVALENLAVITAINLEQTCKEYKGSHGTGATPYHLSKAGYSLSNIAMAMQYQAKLLYSVVESDVHLGLSMRPVLQLLDRAIVVTRALEAFRVWESNFIADHPEDGRGIWDPDRVNWSGLNEILLERFSEDE